MYTYRQFLFFFRLFVMQSSEGSCWNHRSNWNRECLTYIITRTHGQPAVPSTLGKEIQVFHYRLTKQIEILKNIQYFGKFGGAVGNLNAHYLAYPHHNWELYFIDFMTSIGLKREILTTQIDNYENLSTIFDQSLNAQYI